MNSKKRVLTKDFYEIQRRQWQKSLLLFLVLLVFYFLLVGFIGFVVLLSLGLIMPSQSLLSGENLRTFLWINAAVSVLVAVFHFYDARMNGAKFIRKQLQASPPDPSDRYHQQFANTVEEIRLASGLPAVKPFIIPVFAINSMALIESDKTPSVVVSEGLLADFTRDELQAVIAHELAHIIRGDTFYITMVCSLANVFEKLRIAFEPESEPPARTGQGQNTGGGHPFIYLAATFSTLIMRLLSTLVSRQREILADAAAVELSRNPAALARAIYKAHVKNSFVGDFNLTYSPLFIVPPYSKGDGESFLSRIFDSHPPLMKRIRLLAEQIPSSPAKIIEEVWEIQKNREKSKEILHSPEEYGMTPDQSADIRGDPERDIGKIWSIRASKGKWLGPMRVEDILALPFFSPKIMLRNLQEDVEAPASEFIPIRIGMRKQYHKQHINPARKNKCPRCRIHLQDTFYEGIPIQSCTQCRGKLIETSLIDRIVARRELGFSDHLRQKAKQFREDFMWNPVKIKKIDLAKEPEKYCPGCGSKMLTRPYNYQYIVPVDKCLTCYKTWFDTDELEILQLLIEEK